MERKTNRKKWCYPAISLGLAVLYAVLLLCAVQQWLSPFLFFEATFVLLLLFVANAASGVTFSVLKKKTHGLLPPFCAQRPRPFFLCCTAFSCRQWFCYKKG